MLEWWNDIRMLVARYLVASDQMERSGPVAAAVRQAGYISEDEDLSEEEDGSSLDEPEGNYVAHDADAHYVMNNRGSAAHESAPTYTSHEVAKDSGIELDEHGYRKVCSTNKPASGNPDLQACIAQTIKQGSLGPGQDEPGVDTNTTSSRRLEKAPEGSTLR